ncbi:Processing of GAS1 and ALP protein 2 [Saccharomyces pastorianus]|uniref:Processing of GAS1 and ALP protein 2 n=1 Tax=Saccharomyces pastorianus TaxID=27292 RepID=A0A6C1EE40_SACPS|nr:PGA2-like protein [Saccharomyces eubayanus]KOG97015.1 PGA2-like protein [Saccharomyces eubayanus]QID87638.1 Processing of GAS1 and ALP protein 2 [Saccharomyces pastorianus]
MSEVAATWIETLLTRIINYDYKHFIRLVMIVGGYMLVRNIASRELAKKQLAAQVEHDKREKEEKRSEELIDKLDGPSVAETTSFGWGKKTRQRVKKQQELFEKALEEAKQKQQGRDPDSDADIEELLEE